MNVLLVVVRCNFDDVPVAVFADGNDAVAFAKKLWNGDLGEPRLTAKGKREYKAGRERLHIDETGFCNVDIVPVPAFGPRGKRKSVALAKGGEA